MMKPLIPLAVIIFYAGVALPGVSSAAEDNSMPGTFSLDSRLRFETAEQAGKKRGESTSLRLRPGFTTDAYSGFQAMVEGEFNLVVDKDKYNAAGVHGNPDKSVIADPENVQLDQAWLSYTHEASALKAGRQVITRDNQRWIGHVGWRQNRQTYDAVTLQNSSVEDLTLSYGYLDNVVRIFGDDAPSMGGNAEEFGSESHLLNAAYDAGELGKVTVYGYLLELEDAPGKIAGSDTFGISYDASCTALEGMPIGVYAEYAKQSDAGDNVQDYTADYLHFAADASYQGASLTVGWESLGSDEAGVDDEGNPTFASVKTPLATLHKFNGFADVFLTTPDRGLEDLYVMAGYTLQLGDAIGPLTAKVWYHDFQSDESEDDFGDEVDIVLIKPIKLEGVPGKLSFLAKYADYSAPRDGANVERFSIELDYAVSF